MCLPLHFKTSGHFHKLKPMLDLILATANLNAIDWAEVEAYAQTLAASDARAFATDVLFLLNKLILQTQSVNKCCFKLEVARRAFGSVLALTDLNARIERKRTIADAKAALLAIQEARNELAAEMRSMELELQRRLGNNN